MSIVDVGTNFADTAAIIESLDLTISIDTSVAHLAGALGRPVWTLLMNPPEWRWMSGRNDSPWYPTMRLFRQPKQGDWPGAIRDLANALREAVQRSRNGPARAEPNGAGTFIPLSPAANPQQALPGLTGAAETIAGTVQYDPEQPIVGKAIEYYGEYLRPQVELLARMMTTDSLVIEVSPGVGMHVLSLAPANRNGGHFFLYESRPLLARVLRQNLAANAISNVTLMKRVLAGSASTRKSASDEGDGMAGEVAGNETIDELRLDRLDWIKISEDDDAIAILRGAAETLWRLRPKLFVGVRKGRYAAEFTSFARDFGYACWRFETPLFNPANFNLRDDDAFQGRSAIAVISMPEEAESDGALEGCTRMTAV